YLSVPQSPIRNMCWPFGSGAGAGFGAIAAWPAKARRGAVAAKAEKAKVWRRNWRRFGLGSNRLDIRLGRPYGSIEYDALKRQDGLPRIGRMTKTLLVLTLFCGRRLPRCK